MIHGSFQNYHGEYLASFYTGIMDQPQAGQIRTIVRSDGTHVSVKLISKRSTKPYGKQRLTFWDFEAVATL